MRRLALVVAVTTTAFTLGAVAPANTTTAAAAAAAGRPSAPVALAAAAAGAAVGKVSYRPPVSGPVVDEFLLPGQKWQPGNRGIDYAPPEGTLVKASADGEVTFSGQVGGELHVVVLHADGIRTTYAFLQTIAVHRGDVVRQGQTVGTARGDGFHFGARVGEQYIDPRTLFDQGLPHVFLVPDDVRRPGSETEERRGLSGYLKILAEDGRKLANWVYDQAKDQVVGTLEEFAGLGHWALQFNPFTHAYYLVRTGADWYRQRDDCTSADVEPPPLPERRIAVLVGGLGSKGEAGKDDVDKVDTDRLGYDESVRFSYLGGTVEENPYEQKDTTTDLRLEGERLRDLLAEMERRHPGVPIDIIAHSQGGIIAREALAHGWDDDDRQLPTVRNIVTLATPHQGTDVATGLTMLNHTDVGGAALQIVDATPLSQIDTQGPSISQLSEASAFLWNLNHTPLPEGVQLTSIGSRGDLLVPGIHTRAPGGRNVLVSLDGVWNDHSELPGSVEGQREVALAAAGLPPTCQTLTNMLADTVVSDLIATSEDAIAAALYAGAKRLDGKLERKEPTPHDPDPPRPPPPNGPRPPEPRQT